MKNEEPVNSITTELEKYFSGDLVLNTANRVIDQIKAKDVKKARQKLDRMIKETCRLKKELEFAEEQESIAYIIWKKSHRLRDHIPLV